MKEQAEENFNIAHMERVAQYSFAIAKDMGLDEEECAFGYFAGLMHDVGKAGMPDEILFKPGRLSNHEMLIMQNHTIFGYYMLMAHVNIVPKMKAVAETARWHHERLDGSGYPDHLTGDQIPLLARIVAVADSFDAMTHKRPYSEPKSAEAALYELKEMSMQYDEKCVTALEQYLMREQARGEEVRQTKKRSQLFLLEEKSMKKNLSSKLGGYFSPSPHR